MIPSRLLGQLNTPVYSNEFLHLGMGGRALGMGNTHVAMADDATRGYYNPAGLASLSNPYSASLMHASYFAGIANYDVAAIAAQVDSLSGLSITALRFGVDDIPDTRFLYDASGALDYDRVRFFSAADYAFLLSYARRIAAIPGLSVGGSIKVVHRVAGNFAQAWGFGIDLAGQYYLGSWTTAVVVRDATGTFNAWTHNTELLFDIFTLTGNEVPENSLEVTLPQMHWGNAYRVNIGQQWRITTALDLAVTFDGQRNVLLSGNPVSVDPRLGIETSFRELAMLRLGVSNFQRVPGTNGEEVLSWQPNAGLGVRYRKWGVDYAFTDLGDQSEALFSHIISVQFAW